MNTHVLQLPILALCFVYFGLPVVGIAAIVLVAVEVLLMVVRR